MTAPAWLKAPAFFSGKVRKQGRFALVFLLILCATAAVAWGVYSKNRPGFHSDLPTAVAKRGEFLVIVSCRGELVAGKSVQLTAPLNVPDLRIVWMAPAGSPVKAGDLILRFDTSSAQRLLNEKEAEMKQAQASVDQGVADAKIKLETDSLEVATQKTAVERARLEASKKDIVSALQAEASRVDLSLAEQKLRVLQATLELNQASAQSKIASFRSQLKKVSEEAALTRKRISQMEVRSPSEGVVNFTMNYSQGWVNAKPFRVGDNVWPGSAIAEIPDLRSLQIKAKLEEIERGKTQLEQPTRILLDPFPEKPFDGTLASISPLTEQTFEWPPSRNFRAYASFKSPDPRLRPGMNGRLDIIVDRIADAISVPAKAIFARDGKPVVITMTDKGLKPVRIEIIARNPDEVAIRGISQGTKVTLVEDGGDQKNAPGAASPGAKS